jgi:hypothetical protein
MMCFTDLAVRDSHRREVSDDLFDGGIVSYSRQGLSGAKRGQGDPLTLSHLAVKSREDKYLRQTEEEPKLLPLG